MFKQASKVKLRFKTSVGALTTEDLWELPLEVLDSLAIELNKDLKDTEQVSFITDKPRTNATKELQFSILKEIINDKLLQKAEALERQANRVRKTQLIEALEAKRQESLLSMSEEELLKELEGLK
jgi:hypothetical protein